MDLNAYSYFINQLQLSTSKHQLYYDVIFTKKTKELAHLLLKLNVIRRFHRTSQNSHYRVFPTYTKFRHKLRPIKVYLKTNGHIKLNIHTLRLLNFSSPHSYYILETNLGLLTHKEALHYKVGGLLLMIIL